MPDEFIGHRIGLIPILWDGETYLDERTVILEKIGKCDVTSGDFKDEIINQNVLICRLSEGQRLKLSATIKFGTGETNSKWSPVNVVTFTDCGGHYQFKIETNGLISLKALLDNAEIQLLKSRRNQLTPMFPNSNINMREDVIIR